jgi:hypothetical protein
MGARLATALGFTVATAWRSECDIEGLDVQVPRDVVNDMV